MLSWISLASLYSVYYSRSCDRGSAGSFCHFSLTHSLARPLFVHLVCEWVYVFTDSLKTYTGTKWLCELVLFHAFLSIWSEEPNGIRLDWQISQRMAALHRFYERRAVDFEVTGSMIDTSESRQKETHTTQTLTHSTYWTHTTHTLRGYTHSHSEQHMSHWTHTAALFEFLNTLALYTLTYTLYKLANDIHDSTMPYQKPQ